MAQEFFGAIPCPANYFSPLNSGIKVNSSFLVKATQKDEDLSEVRKGEVTATYII